MMKVNIAAVITAALKNSKNPAIVKWLKEAK